MPNVGFVNVARFRASSSGTGDFVVSSAITGYQTPALAGAVNTTIYRYRAESDDLTQWEIGYGAYTSGSVTLARTTVLYNSSGTGTGAGQSGAGTKISFSAAPQVAVVFLAEDFNATGQIPGTTTNDNASAGNIGELVSCISPNNPSTGAPATATVTITNASPGVVSWTSHGFVTGNPVYFTTTGTLPTGLSPSTNYYVSSAGNSANAFQVSTTVANAIAGTSINTSSAGSGTHTGHSSALYTTGASGTPVNICGISLTAGDWDISLNMVVIPGASMTTTYLTASLSTTTATLDVTNGRFGNTAYPSASAVVNGMSIGVFPARFSLSATTTVFAIFQGSIATANAEVYGNMRARRVR